MKFCTQILLCIVAATLTACTTVSPDFPRAHTVAYGSDGLMDAGVKGQVVDVRTGAHMILMESADRTHFNNLVVTYGKQFDPALTKDEGIVSYQGQYAFRNDILGDYIVMKKWEKRDASP